VRRKLRNNTKFIKVTMNDKLSKKIKQFNTAYNLIDKGLKLIKREFEETPYKAEWAAIILAEKRIDEMYKVILKCMESDATDEEFKKIIETLKDK